MIGQINLGTIEGDLLFQLSKREDVNSIVEIGTWTGLGSTMCLIQGIINSGKKKEFISLELYPEMHWLSIENLFKYLEYVKIINGKIIEYDDVFWFDHNKLIKSNDLHAKLFYKKDMDYVKKIKNVLDSIPKHIDLLVLDGGEYTTYPEWQKLKDRVKIVVLDDTNILKCSRIRNEIISSNQYDIIYDNLYNRNGFSVFEKK